MLNKKMNNLYKVKIMTEKNNNTNCEKKDQVCTMIKMNIPGCGMREFEMCLTASNIIQCYPGQGEIKDTAGKVIGCSCPPGEVFKDNKCNLPSGATRDENTKQLVCKPQKRTASDGKTIEVATEPVYFKDEKGNNTNVIAGCCAKPGQGRIRKEFFHENDGTLIGCCADADGTCDIVRSTNNNGLPTK
jgi:hypothetical protein